MSRTTISLDLDFTHHTGQWGTFPHMLSGVLDSIQPVSGRVLANPYDESPGTLLTEEYVRRHPDMPEMTNPPADWLVSPQYGKQSAWCVRAQGGLMDAACGWWQCEDIPTLISRLYSVPDREYMRGVFGRVPSVTAAIIMGGSAPEFWYTCARNTDPVDALLGLSHSDPDGVPMFLMSILNPTVSRRTHTAYMEAYMRWQRGGGPKPGKETTL